VTSARPYRAHWQAARLEAQLLTTPSARHTEDVLERVLAVQAQDPRGARLAIRARSSLAGVDDVDEALSRRRSAVITWLNRGTLHLVRAEDYWWLHPLTAPQQEAGNRRRLQQEGLAGSAVVRGLDVIGAAVRDEGPMTRSELKARLDRANIPTGGQALVHLLAAASRLGLVVRGPMRAGESAYVDVAGWLGPAPSPVDDQEALARLARRFLLGHGPATAADLTKWAGITLGRARTGLASIAGEVTALGEGAFVHHDAVLATRLPSPRLLGAFDPLLHGWKDRSPVVGSHRGLVTVNGIFRPTALVGGRVVGRWRLAGGRVGLELLEAVGRKDLRALERDAVAVLSYLGLPARGWEVVGP
jgi:hypothetical protein